MKTIPIHILEEWKPYPFIYSKNENHTHSYIRRMETIHINIFEKWKPYPFIYSKNEHHTFKYSKHENYTHSYINQLLVPHLYIELESKINVLRSILRFIMLKCDFIIEDLDWQ